MASPIHQLWSNVVFAYDLDTLTLGGLLRDFGPNGLHATPGAGAAAPTKQPDGSYSFDGGDYFSLSGDAQARFYANAPTGAHTWLFSVSEVNFGSGGRYLFSTYNFAAGMYYGSSINTTNPTIFRNFLGDGGAVLNQLWWRPVPKGLDRTSIIATVETTPRAYCNTVPETTTTWAAGSFNAVVYDPTVVPTIGNGPLGWIGRIRYLALLRVVPTNPEMLALNQSMRDGGKPWCWR